MNNHIDMLFAAKNNLANTILDACKSGLTVKDYELVETESSKYREWSSPAEYENGHSCLDYAVLYNNVQAVAVLLMISRKTWEERNKFNKKDIENALRLAKKHNVSKVIINLLLYANGEDIDEKVNPDGKPLTSEARYEYGSQGEIIKEYVEHHDKFAKDALALTKLEANNAKIKQVLMELQYALFEKLGITSEDFFNDFEGLKGKLTQEDLETLCGRIEYIYGNDEHLTEVRRIRDAIRKVVDAHGGIIQFPREDREGMLFAPAKLRTYLTELAESKVGELRGYGVVWDSVINAIKGELDEDTRKRGESAKGAKKALDALDEKYEYEYIGRKAFEPNIREEGDKIPWQWEPYNFENCVRLIKSGRKLH